MVPAADGRTDHRDAIRPFDLRARRAPVDDAEDSRASAERKRQRADGGKRQGASLPKRPETDGFPITSDQERLDRSWPRHQLRGMAVEQSWRNHLER